MALFRNLKPLPKLILIAGPIILSVWAYSTFAPKPVEQPAQKPAPVVVVPAEASLPPPAASAAPVIEAPAAPSTEAPVLQPAGGSDAGLAAVLKAGKK